MNIRSIAVLLLFMGCSVPKESAVQNLTFSSQEILAKSCEEENCAKVEITFPEASPTEAGNKMNIALRSRLMAYFRPDTTYADLEAAAEDYIHGYNEFKADFPNAPGAWAVEIKVENSYESDSLISFKFSEYNFSGGAHPNSSINFINFDKSTGNILSTEKFILDQPKLLEMVEKKFLEHHQVPEGTLLTEDLRFFLPETGFFLPNAMGYEGDKFRVIYIPYEIGPYALGYTELSFELDDLDGIVKK